MRLPTRPSLIASCFLALAALCPGQPSGRDETRFERFRRLSREAEARGLAEPFRGLTTDGKIEPGLFPLRSTGVSTAPVQEAAANFLRQLTAEQRARTTFPVDDSEWRKWMNQHFYLRQGVSFQELSAPQRAAAFGLLRASLSARGLRLSEDIMKLNHTLGELNHDDFDQYGQWLYHLTVMGEPSATRPWGWQIDGHHLIVNYFVLGDQVVMSPVFFGSEPVVAPSGKFQGVAVLQEEQAAGLAMFRALRDDQRTRAVLRAAKTSNDNLTEAFKDNVILPYAGLAGAALTEEQQRRLLALIELFVGHLDEGHAQVKMTEVRAHLARTHFAWIGGSADDSTFYFRIHSPVLLIEFDHQRPANLRHLSAHPQLPDRQHIHVVIRTPNGNDYGQDLLRQHYARERH